MTLSFTGNGVKALSTSCSVLFNLKRLFSFWVKEASVYGKRMSVTSLWFGLSSALHTTRKAVTHRAVPHI